MTYSQSLTLTQPLAAAIATSNFPLPLTWKELFATMNNPEGYPLVAIELYQLEDTHPDDFHQSVGALMHSMDKPSRAELIARARAAIK